MSQDIRIIAKPITYRVIFPDLPPTAGDMFKSVYDSDNDGIVDFAKDLDLTNEEWTQFNLILLS